MREPHRIADTVGLIFAAATVILFVLLAFVAWYSDSPAPAIVFVGFSILLSAAIHAERSRR